MSEVSVSAPLISVIVPCHNSAEFIERTLAALLPQIADDVELILVDNNSSDGTLALLEKAASSAGIGPRFRVLSATAGQGVNVARNFGAARASGRWLLFTDHDDAVCPGWVTAFRQAFDDGAEIVAGPYLEMTSNGSVISEVSEPESHLWDIPYGLGANCGITRSGFELVGGFRPHWIGGGDDADFFWRAHFAGLELVFVPEAKIVHFMRDSGGATFRQYRGYGRSAVRLFVEFRSLGMPRSSTWRAMLACPVAIGELVLSLVGIGSRRRALSRLGVRLGRLQESVRQKVLYL
ncbi:MAG: glycosyltransferase family 2 protein [Promicromonosporaceae bacterium]|nr:glycosyltransferase family 2 protein [Promicromonosporaceae bacterium]